MGKPHNSLLEFYDVDWKTVGTKLHLCSRIIARTSIPESTLLEPWNLDFQEFPAGRRFSWAWDRTTTRDEDLAYSLMGLLGVSMPLLYGEGGGKAFIGSSKNTSCNGRTCRFFSGHRGLAAVLAPSWPDARPSSTLARSDISTGTQNPATSPMIALRGRMLFLSDTRATLWPSPVEGCGSNFWPCEIARHTGQSGSPTPRALSWAPTVYKTAMLAYLSRRQMMGPSRESPPPSRGRIPMLSGVFPILSGSSGRNFTSTTETKRKGPSARWHGRPSSILSSGSISRRPRWSCDLTFQNQPKSASPFPRQSLDEWTGAVGTHSLRNASPFDQRTAACCPYNLALWSWISRSLLPKTVRRASKPWLLPLGSLVRAQPSRLLAASSPYTVVLFGATWSRFPPSPALARRWSCLSATWVTGRFLLSCLTPRISAATA